MAIKKISNALEGGFLLGVNIFYKLTKIADVPNLLIKEADSFMKRNSLAVVACNIHNKEHVHECCPCCLEAHLVRKAKELDLDNDHKEAIRKIFECEIGHNGYYLDKGRLIRV